jgi:HEAT repeat protein
MRALLVAMLLPPVAVRASTLDDLLADLGGADEVARSRARVLLPRENLVEAAPKLVAMAQQGNPAVAYAAFNVLMDCSADASVPGREAERAALAGQIMTLLAPDKPPAVKERGLRLLPFVVPEGMNLGPLADLLAGADAVLAEKARAALQEIGTSQARAVLREHLPKAAPDFQCAILDALAALKDAESLALIEGFTSSADARLRAAAARALAWTGDPFRLKTVKRVVAQADDATRSEATDALVRLLNAVEEKGGNWEIVTAGYRELLQTGPDAARDAALAGLGRIGDETCVPAVLAAVRESAAPTRLVGLAALRQMQGVGVTRALAAEYPKQPEDVQLALLEALGSKKHPLVLPVLTAAARSSRPDFRLAGLNALGESELPDGLPVLVEAAKAGGDAEKAAARGGILRLAGGLRAAGRVQEAGRAYVAAMQAAGEGPPDRIVLEGLAACPTAEAWPGLRSLSGSKDLAAPGARALIATAKALTASKRQKEAIEALELARALDASPETARVILAGLRDAGAAGDYAAMLGLITHWSLVGPFELGDNNAGWNRPYVSEPDVSLTGKYMSGKRRVEWTPAPPPDDRGVIDLHKAFGPGDKLVGYACTEITVEKDTPAVLLLGVDDSARAWVNGRLVHDQFVARPLTPDQDVIPIQLKAGRNVILLKIWQNTLGWEFCARLTAPDGKPLAFTQGGR